MIQTCLGVMVQESDSDLSGVMVQVESDSELSGVMVQAESDSDWSGCHLTERVIQTCLV